MSGDGSASLIERIAGAIAWRAFVSVAYITSEIGRIPWLPT